MPLVKVEMIKGKSREYKQTMLEQIRRTLIEVLGIADWDRFQRVIEIDRDDFQTSDDKTDSFTIIELTLFPGRSKEVKKELIEKMTKAISDSLSVPPTDIFIIINEPPLENWGLAGRQMG